MRQIEILLPSFVWNLTLYYASHALLSRYKSWAAQRRQDASPITTEKFFFARIVIKTANSCQTAPARRGEINFHVHFEVLYVRVLFGVVFNLAVDMLLGSLHIDSFIRGILPSNRKFVPWRSHPVAILSTNPLQKPASLHDAVPTGLDKPGKHNEDSPILIRTE